MNMHWVRLLGTLQDHRESALVAVVMGVVTIAYTYVSSLLIEGYEFNVFEFVGTWSGLITVWLARTRNVLCWPWGLLSALALGQFFAQIGLPGQQWLNWGYFFVIQVWAWGYWVYGGYDNAELPVTSLKTAGRIAMVATVVAGTAIVLFAIDWFAPTSQYPFLDALVVAASIVAQFLLGKKKVESWLLWLGPVNVVSIILFTLAGAYTLTALYVAFFIHALFALRSWKSVQQ